MPKILLVEDDPLLIDIYRTKLKEAGFQIEVSEDGEAALSQIEQNKPDLVLLDIVLPRQDGWAFMKALNEKDQASRPKVVVLSNLGQREEIDRAFEMGAAGYLIKANYTPSQVVEEVKRQLSNSNADSSS